ncbi:MAG: hypothetical protein K0R63_1846 [Rickettsiales bacterium]|jgi:membrane-associated phospholipid phosphatase|nr:hypothetical protein [Rickettsiales bacterium]
MALVFGVAGGIALIGSWFYPLTRAGWDTIDQAWFFLANGSLAEGSAWQIVWALANFRGFDLIAALSMVAVFAYAAKQRDKDHVVSLAKGLLMALYTVLMVQCAHELFENIKRDSPTRILEPVYLLSELVPWAYPKDSSGTSFPGDHATVLLMVATFITYYFGKRYGLIAYAIAVIGVLPRIVGGAHWLTDVVVGGGGITLITMTLVLATPLERKLFGLLFPFAGWCMAIFRKVRRKQ